MTNVYHIPSDSPEILLKPILVIVLQIILSCHYDIHLKSIVLFSFIGSHQGWKLLTS